MLKLHGFDVSNYYNMAKCLLLEKQAEYEAVTVYPNQEAAFLGISPMGKVPVLETEQGYLTESNVIMEFLDDTLEGPRFYPGEPFARARTQEIVKLIELYIELPARRCYPQAFFGRDVSEETRAATREALLKGVAALRRQARFQPYLMGTQISAADIMFLFSFDLAAGMARKLFQLDLFEALPGSSELFERLKARDSVKTIQADRETAMTEFQNYAKRRADR
jgi:glutathione S-transferase